MLGNDDRLAGAIILKISHGYTIEPAGPDPLVDLADEAVLQFSLSSAPGAWLVDVMPFRASHSIYHSSSAQRAKCTFFDGWNGDSASAPSLAPRHRLPAHGGAVAEDALRARGQAARVRQGADGAFSRFGFPSFAFVRGTDIYFYFAFCKAAGTAAPSYTSELLAAAGGAPDAEAEHIIKWSAASLYSGGADTVRTFCSPTSYQNPLISPPQTVSAMYSFFLAMVLHPDVQRTAQAELDAVVGGERFPTFEDRTNLPYIDAMVKEVLRWNPVVPMGA